MTTTIKAGLDGVLDEDSSRFGRIGWLANGSAVTSQGLLWGPRAALRAGLNVVQLFGAEHGPHGAVRAGQRIEDATDGVTGLPVCSLYSSAPASVEAGLDSCDTVFIDLVDNGARYSTYIATATELVEAAARAGVAVVVLDRPNLLGRRREGPGLASGVRSLVGKLDIPIRHGLTLGEILRWHVQVTGLDVSLEVVRAEGWRPADPDFPEPFLPASPNMNVPAAQLLYPGTCLVEGTVLSEGRGTANPFQVIGAPWLDAEALVDVLSTQRQPGVAFRAVRFVPYTSKHANEACAGVFIHVTDMKAVRPVALGVGLLSAIVSGSVGSPDGAGGSDGKIISTTESGKRFLDLLWGSAELAVYLAAGCPADADLRLDARDDFEEDIADFLLY